MIIIKNINPADQEEKEKMPRGSRLIIKKEGSALDGHYHPASKEVSKPKTKAEK